MKVAGITMLVLLGIMVLGLLGFIGTTCNNLSNQTQEHAVNNAYNSYEDFQEMYNSCQKINSDLCNIQKVSDTDKMFQQFSKSQRLTALRTNLNRWVEEYNGKSKMWNRSLWKSKTLPYQLSSTDFNCY